MLFQLFLVITKLQFGTLLTELTTAQAGILMTFMEKRNPCRTRVTFERRWTFYRLIVAVIFAFLRSNEMLLESSLSTADCSLR